jgi:hypothetical protein
MTYTIDETFCHIQREENWQIGDEYLIGLEENNLTKQLETEKKIYAEGSIQELEQNEIKQKAEYFSSYHMFVRETVFEDIRLKYFPELPSRRHGIWLCKEGDNLNYWKSKLHNLGTTFEVQVTGKIHKVCAKNLSSDGAVLSRALYSQQAFKYWSGQIHSEESVEYLFIGRLKVIAKK